MSDFHDVRTYEVDMSDRNQGPIFTVVVEWDGMEPMIRSVCISTENCHHLMSIPPSWCDAGQWELYDYLSDWTIDQIMTRVTDQRAVEDEERASEIANDPVEIQNRKGDEAYHRMVDKEVEK